VSSFFSYEAASNNEEFFVPSKIFTLAYIPFFFFFLSILADSKAAIRFFFQVDD